MHTFVAIDANVLINFVHIERLELLHDLPKMTFVVPGEVTNEITNSKQASALQGAFAAGRLKETSVSGVAETEHYAHLIRRLGKGESACLALAKSRDWSLASDEKRPFRRIAIGEIGEKRIWTTPDLIVLAIRAGYATVEQADRWKELLAEHRFLMKIDSFRELL